VDLHERAVLMRGLLDMSAHLGAAGNEQRH
jgi:hypothetical protein